MESSVQLRIISPDAEFQSRLFQQSHSSDMKNLVPLLLLSLFSCIIHLYYLSTFIQELCLLGSILSKILTDLASSQLPSKKYSFGYGRVISLNSFFTVIFLGILVICDIYLQVFIKAQESSVPLHLISMTINLLQLLIFTKFQGLIRIILMWTSVSHLLCICPDNVRLFLVAAQDVIVIALAVIECWKEVIELMEGIKVEKDLERFEKRIRNVVGVADVHDLHNWNVGKDTFVSLHIVTNDNTVIKPVKYLCEMEGFSFSTIQIENENFKCKSYKFH